MYSLEDWRKKIDVAREIRDKQKKRVWSKLHDAWVGRLMQQDGRPEAVNPFSQFVEVVAPQLIWDEPEAIVQPYRARPGVDPMMTIEFGKLLADQATAIGRAIFLRQEVESCLFDFFWSCGIMLFGFNPPIGMAEEKQDEGLQKETKVKVDLDWAKAEHHEKQDAGMPFARSVAPTRFLGDHTFGRFERGEWFGVEYYLSMPEFKKLYPECATDANPTHTSEPKDLDRSRFDDEQDDYQEGGKRIIQCIDIYTRYGEVFTLADKRSNIQKVCKKQEIDLGIEGLPFLMLGRSWSRSNPYPIPPMAAWYGAATNEEAFLDKLMDEGSKVRGVHLVNEAGNQDLADAIRNSDNQGVISVTGDPNGIIKSTSIGMVNRDDREIYNLSREVREIGSGTSEFQMGARERGEMTATEADALQSATNIRLTGMKTPVYRFIANSYRNLMAITYQKIHVMAGNAFPLGQGVDLRYAVIDPNQPRIGEIIDYHFDVGISETPQLSRQRLGQERREMLELFLRPDIVQKLQMEGMDVQIAPLFREILKDLRSREIESALVPLPPPPPPEQQAPGPEQQAPPQEGAPPQEAPPQQGPPPAQENDPIAQYQELFNMLLQTPDGDPSESQIIDQLAQMRVALNGV